MFASVFGRATCRVDHSAGPLGTRSFANLWAVCLFTALLASCGQVAVQEPIAAIGDVGDNDLGGQDASGDSTPTTDTLAADVQGECATDFDCASMKGKTPCNVPKCDLQAGKCVLKPRSKGEACVNPFDEAGECEQALCDDSAQCIKSPKVDKDSLGNLTACGLTACGKICKAGSCVTAGAVDYSDSNPCTQDYCDQGKEIKHDPITDVGVICDDGTKCTENDSCQGGKCVGTALVCNDGIPCTEDSCDKSNGCKFTPLNKLCVDSDPCVKIECDLAEGCTATGNEFNVCDDNNPCTTSDICKEGKCTGKASTTGSCGCKTDDDCAINNTKCGGKFTCNKTTLACELQLSTVVKCPVLGDICAVSACDDASGECLLKAQNEGKSCEDSDACTVSTLCVAGKCSGTSVVCDDKNPCTLDSCGAIDGCLYTVTTGECSDGLKCTTGDICAAAGVCLGAKKSCDDGIPCTYDSCDEASGTCTHQVGDAGCDDKNPCTKDTCDASKGCTTSPDDSAKCDDGNSCTSDICQNGVCKSANQCQCTTNAECDDKNPCTVDTCNAGKCGYTAAPTTQTCDVGNKCVIAGTGTCQAGACVGGKPVDCAGSSDACNNAQCNPTTGKCEAVSKADGTGCDADGTGCTVSDTCKGGKCVAGAAANCPPSLCNQVFCKSTSPSTYACQSTPIGQGIACDDGKNCTVGDTCDGAGKCVATPVACGISGNPCAPMVCDEAQGCVIKPKVAGDACDDGKYCTASDTCSSTGQCVGGPPPSCAPIKLGVCDLQVCNESIKACSVTNKPECCDAPTDCNFGWSCLGASYCDYATNQCVPKLDTGCCDQNMYLNGFDENLLKRLTLKNSSGPFQGWQLAQRPQPCPLNGPGCDKIDSKFVLYYGDTKLWSFDFGQSSGVVTLPIATVPKDFGWAFLDFDLYMATEAGGAFDILSVSVQPLPPTSTGPQPDPWVIWQKEQGPPLGQPVAINQWQNIKIDLQQTLLKLGAGTKYQLMIKFDTVDSAVNQTMGVMIDNLNLAVGYTLGVGWCSPVP